MADSDAAAFLFADIAGFTALTEAHGDEDAADLVADFADAVRAELPASGGTHVRRSATRSCCASPIPPKPCSWASAQKATIVSADSTHQPVDMSCM